MAQEANEGQQPQQLSEEARVAAISSANDKFARGKAKVRENALAEAIDLFSDALKLLYA